MSRFSSRNFEYAARQGPHNSVPSFVYVWLMADVTSARSREASLWWRVRGLLDADLCSIHYFFTVLHVRTDKCDDAQRIHYREVSHCGVICLGGGYSDSLSSSVRDSTWSTRAWDTSPPGILPGTVVERSSVKKGGSLCKSLSL